MKSILAIAFWLTAAAAFSQTAISENGCPGNCNRTATPVSTTQAGSSPGGGQLPSSPAAPTERAQCYALEKQWSDMLAEISKQHSACLDAHSKDHDSRKAANGCSQYACQHLHDPMGANPQMKKYHDDSVKWCNDRVADHLKALADAQKLQDANAQAARQMQAAMDKRRADAIAAVKKQQQASADAYKKNYEEARRLQDEAERKQQEYQKLLIKEYEQRQANREKAKEIEREGKDDQDQIANEGKLKAVVAGAIGGIEVADGSIEAGLALSNDPRAKALAQAYSAGKNVGNMIHNGTSDLTSATALAANASGDNRSKAAADLLKAGEKAANGDYVGAAGSAVKGAGSIAKDYESTSGAAPYIKAAGSAATIYKGGSHIKESANTYSEIDAISESAKRQADRRIEAIDQREAADRQRTLDQLRELDRPIVATVQNYGTLWGIRPDGSIINMRTADVYYIDPVSGKIVTRPLH
jgi:hypothetical protein